MMPPRPYGIGKYGRNTYDHWRINENWLPIPIDPPVDIWVPIPVNPPGDIWAPSSAVNPTERWIPITEPAQPWVPING